MSTVGNHEFKSIDSEHQRQSQEPLSILLTGASGYIGGRLLPSLENQGYRLRCLARRPEILTPKVSPSTEVVAGDVLDRASLDNALRGSRRRLLYGPLHELRLVRLRRQTGRRRGTLVKQRRQRV